jgi:guanylate kinase
LSKKRFSRRGILFVISAPSGAGKTTLCAGLRRTPDFIYSISCTTRPPRPGEVGGEDYHFITETEFRSRLENGEFLESAEVHGALYGTLREPVLEKLEQGIDVLVDIDTNGAEQIRTNENAGIRESLADVFIMPPDLEELRHRLQKRGTETSDQIETRIRNAAAEMQHWQRYRYTIISGAIEEDLQKFRAIMLAERVLSRRMIQY